MGILSQTYSTPRPASTAPAPAPAPVAPPQPVMEPPVLGQRSEVPSFEFLPKQGMSDDEIMMGYGVDPKLLQSIPGYEPGDLGKEVFGGGTFDPNQNTHGAKAVEGFRSGLGKLGRFLSSIGTKVGLSTPEILAVREVAAKGRKSYMEQTRFNKRYMTEDGQEKLFTPALIGEAVIPSPSLPIPGPAGPIMKTAGRALSGALEGMMFKDVDASVTDAAVGGAIANPALKGTMDVAGKVGSKIVNALTGKLDETVNPEAIRLMERYGIPYSAEDVQNLQRDPSGGLARQLGSFARTIPGSGQTESAIATRNAASGAMSDTRDKLIHNVENAQITAPQEIIDAAQEVNGVGAPTANAKAAQAILAEIQQSNAAPGQDTAFVANVSAKIKDFQSKVRADRAYADVDKAGSGVAVDLTTYRKALQDKLNGMRPTIDNQALHRELGERLKDASGTPSQGLTFDKARKDFKIALSELQQRIEQGRVQNIPKSKAKEIDELIDALEIDMERGAAQHGPPNLFSDYKQADAIYAKHKDQTAFTEKVLADKGYMDETIASFLRPGPGKTERALDLYNSLDDKGREAIRLRLFEDSVHRATVDGVFYPKDFSDHFDKMREAVDVFYQKDSAKVRQLAAAFAQLERLGSNDSTQQAIRRAVGSGAGAMANPGGSMSATSGALGVLQAGGGITKLLTSPALRKFFLAADKAQLGTKESDMALRALGEAAMNEATRAASKEFSTKNQTPE